MPNEYDTDTFVTPPLPPGPVYLPPGPVYLPPGPVYLPPGPVYLPVPLPSGPVPLPSGPVPLPSGPVPLPSGPVPLHEEYQYLDLVRNILSRGACEPNGRNGATRSIFGHMMRFTLQGGSWPLLTTKRIAWKTCAHELFWFLRGQTDNKILQEKGVHIWDANASREFLDGRGLQHYPEGQLGPIYGFQWRHWNANQGGSVAVALVSNAHEHPKGAPGSFACEATGETTKESRRLFGDISNNGIGVSLRCTPGNLSTSTLRSDVSLESGEYQGIDQLSDVIRQLQDPRPDGGRTSRRLLISAWNPEQIDQMALPPCHVIMQFSVRDNQYLSCALYQRSGDVGLGVPFNVASYSLLTHLLAHHCGLIADEFVHFLGNAHIYEDHVAALTEQIQRRPSYDFPKIRIREDPKAHIEEYDVEDIVFVTPYQHAPTISMNMIA